MSTTIPTRQAPLILVAHRQDVVRAFLADNLAADGFAALTAGDQDEALTALQAGSRVDAVPLDLGAETIAFLDRCAELARVVCPSILVLCDRVDELHRSRVLRHGADDIVGVPFSYPELLHRLNQLLARRSLIGR